MGEKIELDGSEVKFQKENTLGISCRQWLLSQDEINSLEQVSVEQSILDSNHNIKETFVNIGSCPYESSFNGQKVCEYLPMDAVKSTAKPVGNCEESSYIRLKLLFKIGQVNREIVENMNKDKSWEAPQWLMTYFRGVALKYSSLGIDPEAYALRLARGYGVEGSYTESQFKDEMNLLANGGLESNPTKTISTGSTTGIEYKNKNASITSSDIPIPNEQAQCIGTDAHESVWKINSEYNIVELPLKNKSEYSYDFTVCWGDGTFDEINSPTDPKRIHTYDSSYNGKKVTVRIKGKLEGWGNEKVAGNKTLRNIVAVNNLGSLGFRDLSCAFYNAQFLESLKGGDLSKVTDVNHMFAWNARLHTIDSSSWNTSNITNMSGMFAGAIFLSTLDFSNWNTSKVIDMSFMFSGANQLKSLDVSNWNTSNVVKMHQMFSYLSNLKTLNLTNWKKSNVKNIDEMFHDLNPNLIIYCSESEFAGRACTKIPVYEWAASGWGECSKSCGGGSAFQVVTCKDIANNEDVDFEYCKTLGSQPPSSISCNTQQCEEISTYEWKEGGWSGCSKTCGGGTNSQTVSCVNKLTMGVVNDSFCNNIPNKPATSIVCNTQACIEDPTYKWFEGGWSGCSKTCGGGTQSQSVTCVNKATMGVVSDSYCSNIPNKPATTTTCNIQSCVENTVYEWHQGGWGDCSATSGSGTKTQTVTCINKSTSATVADSYCHNSGTKPATTTICQPPASTVIKTYEWFTGEWGSCSKTCDTGTKTRDVRCVEAGTQITAIQRSYCEGLPPVSEANCNIQSCEIQCDENENGPDDKISGGRRYIGDAAEDSDSATVIESKFEMEHTTTLNGSTGYGCDSQDWYFFVPHGHDDSIYTNVTVKISGILKGSDLDLYLYDDDSEKELHEIGKSTNSGNGDENVSLKLNNGHLYYIKIIPKTPGSKSTYKLDMSHSVILLEN